MNKLDRLIAIVRWLLVLPVALAAVFVMRTGIDWVAQAGPALTGTYWRGDLYPAAWSGLLGIGVNYILGYTFCYVGAYLAPSHQVIVAVGLAGLSGLSGLLMIAGWMMVPDAPWSDLLAVIGWIAGAGTLGYLAIRGGRRGFEAQF